MSKDNCENSFFSSKILISVHGNQANQASGKDTRETPQNEESA